MAGAVLGNNDVKTGMKSALKALGSNNPFTIQTSGEVSTTVAVQGGGKIFLVLISQKCVECGFNRCPFTFQSKLSQKPFRYLVVLIEMTCNSNR